MRKRVGVQQGTAGKKAQGLALVNEKEKKKKRKKELNLGQFSKTKY